MLIAVVSASLKAGDRITLAGVIVAAVGLAFAGRQLVSARDAARETRDTTRAQFLLNLGPPFRDYFALHTRMRDRERQGRWWKDSSAPASNCDWAELEQYMGLFERMWVLIDQGLLDLDVVDRLYAYRIGLVVRHDDIYERKLAAQADGWKDFLCLWRALDDKRHLEEREPVSAKRRCPGSLGEIAEGTDSAASGRPGEAHSPPG
jgi:hypothetical protein